MLENTNIKQFYPGPILNKTLDITDFLFKDPEQVHITYTYKNEDGSLNNRELAYGAEYEVTKILPSDVTQADAALTASTGRVMLKADLNVALGERLTVYRESAIIQEAQYPRTGPFPAASHEGALDYLTMQNQEQQDQIDRSLKVPISTANFDGALPIPVPARALKINSSGSGFEFSEYDPDTALETTKEYMEGAQTAASNALASQNAAALSASSAASSETVATQQANIAIAKTSEITETYNNAMADITLNKEQSMFAINENRETSLAEIESAKSGAVSSINTTKDNAVSTVKQTGTDEYNKILSTGIDSKLGENLITNCLLEVPQRIKLELNDGVLTLKAGSQVIVPNGFETDGTTPKFDEVVVENDLTLTNYWGTAEKMAIFVLPDATSVDMVGLARVSSGTTAPTATDTRRWYDTNTNLVKSYIGESYTGDNLSFPIAICTKTSTSNDNLLASIDQIFNGMGYIGSTVWVDKGVKGLIPNGRNEDGSLKNVEFTTDNITTIGVNDDVKYFGIKKVGNEAKAGVYSKNLYDEETNTVIYNNVVQEWMYTGTLIYSNSNITSFQPKLPFRAVDYNDIEEQLANKQDKCVHITKTYVNGTSGYRIWSDGYCEQWGRANYPQLPANGTKSTTITFLKKFANVNYCVSHNIITDGGNTTGLRNNWLDHQVERLRFGWYSTASMIAGGTFGWRACGYLASGQY